MPLTTETITWARPRVQNFSPTYAEGYIRALVSLDGAEYDKVAFFDALIEQGVVPEPAIPTGMTREETWAKRWDAYLAPIRAFGLGFAVEEKRQNSPNPARKNWRASSISRAFNDDAIGYSDFMSLQLARTQFPKVTMPLKDPSKTELQEGAAILPLRLFVDTVRGLHAAGAGMYLSRSEIRQLPRCHTHDDTPALLQELLANRAGTTPAGWCTEDPADLDILLNDLQAGHFFRRLSATTDDAPALVPALAGWARTQALADSLDVIDIPNEVEAYYERLMATPSASEKAILATPRAVVALDAGEAELHENTIRGDVGFVGGLGDHDQVLLIDLNRTFRICGSAVEVVLADGAWTGAVPVELVSFGA